MSGALAKPPGADEVASALRELGLLAGGEGVRIDALSGGVSSDIFGARTEGGRALVVKRSIPKLKVAADWRAPVERDVREVAWLRLVHDFDPRLTPEVLAWAPERHLFVMPWLDPASHPVWKWEMACGRVDPAFAGQVGANLVRLHAAMARRDDVRERFGDSANFAALRIDPFLLYTADRHADLAPRLRDLAADLGRRKTTVIWGDASPKNILVGPEGPVFLDAETAVFGDAAFDPAFCLTHLLIKTLWLPHLEDALMACFKALRDAYLAGVDFEPRDALSRRTASLIGGVLLARVDGKSPAGYLDASQEREARRRARALIVRDDLDLANLTAVWRDFVGT